MKPLKLTMRGINSYRTEQTIDFSQLTSYGLFGIFGPTGSGKSSILDAITLALYASLPRSTKNFINIHEKTAAVSFTFSITTDKTRRYQVERSFRYHGKDPSKTVRNYSGRLLELTDTEPAVLADRPSEVTRECTRLLGLNSDDFMRTVVLPQGQFSEFLKLKNADRRSMLQRIFHLEKYGVELTQKIAQARQQHELTLQSLSGQLLAYEDISDERIKELTVSLASAKEQLILAASEKEASKEAFLQADEIRTLSREADTLSQALEEAESHLPLIADKKQRLENGKKAAQISPFVMQAQKAVLSHTQAAKARIELEKTFAASEETRNTLQQKSEQAAALYQERFPLLLKEEQLLLKASECHSLILQWTKKKELRQQDLLHIQKVLTELSNKQASLSEKEASLKASILLLEEKCEALQQESSKKAVMERGFVMEETYREKRRTYEEFKKSLSEEQNSLSLLQKEQSDRTKQLRALFARITCLLKTTQEKEQSLLAELQTMTDKKAALRQEIEQLNQNKLADIIRESLKDGAPCPVCGSVHYDLSLLNHDFAPAKKLEEARQQLSSMEKQETALFEKRQKISAELSLLQMTLNSLSSHMTDSDSPKNPFSPETSGTAQSSDYPDSAPVTNLSDSPEDLSRQAGQLCSSFSSADGRLTQLFRQCQEKQQQLTVSFEQLRQTGQEILSLRSSLGVESFTDARQKALDAEKELLTAQNHLKESRNTLEGLRKQMEQLHSETLTLSGQIASVSQELISYDSFIQEQKELFPKTVSPDTNFDKALSHLSEEKEELENAKTATEKAFQDALQKYQFNREAFLAARQDEEKCAQYLKEAAETLQTQKKAVGFSETDAPEDFCLSAETMATLSAEIEAFESGLQKTKERLTYLGEKLKGQSISEENWLNLQKTYNDWKEREEELQKKTTLLSHERKEQEKRLKEKKKLEKDMEKGLRKKELIHRLELLFKGNSFIEYVAKSRLRYIALEASDILSDISGGNYELEVNESTEFIIRDNKNGGILRPCDTLSGGETFITSLSLALALSSAIQLNGTAPLELFFLDEGFGSLDEDLLDVVMTSLERLPNKKRSIGIITHVDAIRSRVPVKLLVTSSDTGEKGSSLRLEYT